MTAYLVQRLDAEGYGSRYLERRPSDGMWTWDAALEVHATPLTKDEAVSWQLFYQDEGITTRIVCDPLHRLPNSVAEEQYTAAAGDARRI